MSNNFFGFVTKKALTYTVLVAPICAVSGKLFSHYGEWGVVCAIPITAVWVHLLLSGERNQDHDFIKHLVMRFRHYKNL